MRRVTSRTNPLVRNLVRLGTSSRARRGQGVLLLDGAHLIEALLGSGGEPGIVVVSESGLERPEHQALIGRCSAADVVLLPDPLFRAVAVVEHPAGIMAVAPMCQPLAAPRSDCVLMLDGLQDPGNIGALVRSAAAAGVDRILLSPGSADAWSPRALRAGMGGHFRLAVEEQVDLLAAVKTFRGTVFATHGAGGRSPFETDLRGPVALLLGAEGRGLGADLAVAAHGTLSIPMASGVESLNVGAAIAVLLFERVRQIGGSGVAAVAVSERSAGQ